MLADAINRHSREIAESALQPTALHFKDSDAYCTGVTARGVGRRVLIAPKIDA